MGDIPGIAGKTIEAIKGGSTKEKKQEQTDRDAKALAEKTEADKQVELAKAEASQAIADAVARRGTELGETGEFGVDEDEEALTKKTVLGRSS